MHSITERWKTGYSVNFGLSYCGKWLTASTRYCGICVVFPEPVSPSIIRTWWSLIDWIKSSLNGKIGKLCCVSFIVIFFFSYSETSRPCKLVKNEYRHLCTLFRLNWANRSLDKQGNSVARDLPPTGSEANTTIVVFLYILDIDSHCPYLLLFF